ncbi:MAG: hypothetical protein QM500_05640, partial [Methylococcales bacterium]
MVPADGYEWTGVDLATHSPVIVLATATRIDDSDKFAQYKINIIEIIRNEVNQQKITNENITLNYFAWDYSNRTFNNHKDDNFWNNNIGRTECDGGCLCGVNHVFKVGNTYLLFINELGALKSAELIIDINNDEWLKYVRKAKYIEKEKYKDKDKDKD